MPSVSHYFLNLELSYFVRILFGFFPTSIISFSTEWGDGEIRKIPQTKDTLRTRTKEAKMTKKFKTSVQRGTCPPKKRSPCSTRLRKPSRWRQLSIWGERRCSGHRRKSGRDRMTKTWEKNVVLFVDERGTLKRNAHSSKALQVCTPVTLWCSQSHLKGNLFRVLYYLFL